MNTKTVQDVSQKFLLSMPDYPEGAGFGDLSSTGIGTSIEYQDHREFQPGDDIRRIDWNAYARTGRYIIKQYREEVYPKIEVIVDGSRSISLSEQKMDLVCGISSSLLQIGQREKTDGQCVYSGETLVAYQNDWFNQLRQQDFSGTRYLPDQIGSVLNRLRSGSIRYVISDFLFPHNPTKFLSVISRDASQINVIQVLSKEEIDPDLQGGNRLVDVETGNEMDCFISERETVRYKESLRTLNNNLEEAALRLQAKFARCSTEMNLETSFRESLLPAGMVTSAPSAG